MHRQSSVGFLILGSLVACTHVTTGPSPANPVATSVEKARAAVDQTGAALPSRDLRSSPSVAAGPTEYAATRPDSSRLRRLVARAAPEMEIPADAQFVYCRPASETRFSLKLLFSDYRRTATPIIWLAFFAESMTYLTLTAWLVVVLEQAGLAPVQAALAYSYSQLGAIVAILVLARMLDRFGPNASVLSACIAVAAIMCLAIPGLSSPLITVIAILAVACASATHQSLIGIVGGFYPTIIRGNGVGYATGMGRFGAMLGPVIAGYLLSKFPLHYALFAIAAPDLVVAAACIGLDRCARRNASAVASPPGFRAEQLRVS